MQLTTDTLTGFTSTSTTAELAAKFQGLAGTTVTVDRVVVSRTDYSTGTVTHRYEQVTGEVGNVVISASTVHVQLTDWDAATSRTVSLAANERIHTDLYRITVAAPAAEVEAPAEPAADEDGPTIRHAHATGTVIEGTAPGDGVWEIARQHGFRTSHLVGIYVSGSRDQVANRSRINACAEALRAAGHVVTVEVDDTPRPRAVVLAEQAAQLADRRDALDAKASRKQAAADGYRAASDALTEGYAMGQPLLVDHYSYGRELRRVNRAADLHHRAIDGDKDAAAVRARAEAVGGDAAYAATPRATALRIPRLEADLRDLERRLDGYDAARADLHPLTVVVPSDHEATLRARATQVREQLEHDRMLIGKAIESGEWTPWDKETVKVGDLVNLYSTGGDWLLVMRVSAKSVSVDRGRSWTDTVAYAKIRRHSRPEAEKAAAAVKAAKARQKEQRAAVAGWPA